jgi:hypothetical protein
MILALLITGGMQIVSLHRTNATLRTQVNEKRGLREKRTVQAEQAAQAIASSGDKGENTAATGEGVAGLTTLQAEVAALEQRATEHYAANSEETDAPSTNRDPEKGMTKLEYMQNVGQSTPAAALQTFFWAALKGEDQVMVRILAWDESVRPRVQALIDRLPEESRARYPTPEKIWALIISKYALDVSAIHIAETALKDPTNASLTVRGLTGGDEHLPMHLGAAGWQLWLGDGQLKMLSNELTGKK